MRCQALYWLDLTQRPPLSPPSVQDHSIAHKAAGCVARLVTPARNQPVRLGSQLTSLPVLSEVAANDAWRNLLLPWSIFAA